MRKDLLEAQTALDLARKLIINPSLVNTRNARGLTSSINAVMSSGSIESVVAELKRLSSVGANFNIPSNLGFTSVHFAAMNHCLNQSVFDELARGGANFNIQDCIGNTPAYAAVFNRNHGALTFLQSHDANFDIPNLSGDTPAHFAAKNSAIECLRELLSLGADFNIKNNSNETVWDLMGDYSDSLPEDLKKQFDENQLV